MYAHTVTDESLGVRERSTSIKLLDKCRDSTIGYLELGLLVRTFMALSKLSGWRNRYIYSLRLYVT
jgi:hypothetical protein